MRTAFMASLVVLATTSCSDENAVGEQSSALGDDPEAEAIVEPPPSTLEGIAAFERASEESARVEERTMALLSIENNVARLSRHATVVVHGVVETTRVEWLDLETGSGTISLPFTAATVRPLLTLRGEVTTDSIEVWAAGARIEQQRFIVTTQPAVEADMEIVVFAHPEDGHFRFVGEPDAALIVEEGSVTLAGTPVTVSSLQSSLAMLDPAAGAP